MPKPFLIVFGLLVFSQNLSGQFKPFNSFIPVGFTILDSASGDLNNDRQKDIVLILRNKFDSTITDTTRPLLLLEGNGAGKYRLMTRNDHVVLCKGCGGLFGDPYDGITIKKGYFSIEHFGGSNWRWTRIITFRFDPKTRQFILHRDAGFSWSVFEPEDRSESIFNKEDFGKLNFVDYSNEK